VVLAAAEGVLRLQKEIVARDQAASDGGAIASPTAAS
jgi:predicted outer membrane repeat protein